MNLEQRAALSEAVSSLEISGETVNFLYCPQDAEGDPLLWVRAEAFSRKEVLNIRMSAQDGRIFRGTIGVLRGRLLLRTPDYEDGDLDTHLRGPLAELVPGLATAWLISPDDPDPSDEDEASVEEEAPASPPPEPIWATTVAPRASTPPAPPPPAPPPPAAPPPLQVPDPFESLSAAVAGKLGPASLPRLAATLQALAAAAPAMQGDLSAADARAATDALALRVKAAKDGAGKFRMVARSRSAQEFFPEGPPEAEVAVLLAVGDPAAAPMIRAARAHLFDLISAAVEANKQVHHFLGFKTQLSPEQLLVVEHSAATLDALIRGTVALAGQLARGR